VNSDEQVRQREVPVSNPLPLHTYSDRICCVRREEEIRWSKKRRDDGVGKKREKKSSWSEKKMRR
jgi:hypothetical protein